MRLREGLRVVRRADDEVQVGTDPRWAVRIGGLRPDEVAALVAVDAEAGHRTLPIGTERLREVAHQLDQAHLATSRTASRVRRGPGSYDVAAWDLVDGTGRERLARRAAAGVGVLGLGPTGLSAALHLAAVGVGTVLVDDDRPVRSLDVGPWGYRWEDVGVERTVVAARILRDVAPDVVLESTRVPDVLVVVEHGAADPVRAALLLSEGVPHLSVLVREVDVVVGPLVTRTGAPCLHCVELHHSDLDPAWGRVADAVARPAREGAEGAVLASVAGAVASAAVVDHLDTGAPLAASYEIGLPDAIPRRRDWAAHPSCGCAAQSS